MARLWVVLYEGVGDPALMDKARELYPEHRARLDAAHAQGTLLMVGPFGDPVHEGAMSVWSSREAAEEFVAGDPFVVHGRVPRWHLRQWNETFSAS